MAKKTRQADVSQAEMAEASSAHSRINIPLNLKNWLGLKEEIQADLLWFHQQILSEGLGWKEASDAIGYDRSTLFKILKGTYSGSWENVSKHIASYKRIAEQRQSIQKEKIVPNSIVTLIGSALDYALANNSITLIIAEAGQGKTSGLRHWMASHNHGTSVYLDAAPNSGQKMLLTSLAGCIGVNKGQSVPLMYEAIVRAFNPNRMILVDNIHRTMPRDARSMPIALETLITIKDRTGCALGLTATQRFNDTLLKGQYQYEQFLRRIGMPVRIPHKIKNEDFMPILLQYIKRPSSQLVDECSRIANHLGRLGVMVELLKFASRIAAKKKTALTEKHIYTAVKIRRDMMGDLAQQWEGAE